jgi:hypothetical protein
MEGGYGTRKWILLTENNSIFGFCEHDTEHLGFIKVEHHLLDLRFLQW